MINRGVEGGEQFDKNRTISAFDRRHPTQENLNKLLSTELVNAKLSSLYETGHIAMEAFFAAGHPRPEYGDESY